MLRQPYLILFLLFSVFIAKAQKPAPDLGEPVIVNQDTLFKLYAGQGLFQTKERAQIVSKRISDIISRLDFNPDSLVLKNDSVLSVISYKSQLIMAVNNADAKFSELDRPQLAANYLNILKKRMGSVFKNNSAKDIIINILEAIAVVFVLLLLIWLVNRAFRWLNAKLLKAWESRITKLGGQGATTH
jgi:hypothetical protein